MRAVTPNHQSENITGLLKSCLALHDGILELKAWKKRTLWERRSGASGSISCANMLISRNQFSSHWGGKWKRSEVVVVLLVLLLLVVVGGGGFIYVCWPRCSVFTMLHHPTSRWLVPSILASKKGMSDCQIWFLEDTYHLPSFQFTHGRELQLLQLRQQLGLLFPADRWGLTHRLNTNLKPTNTVPSGNQTWQLNIRSFSD